MKEENRTQETNSKLENDRPSTSATITLYNSTTTNPVIKKDGAICTQCTIISNKNGTLVFTVPGF